MLPAAAAFFARASMHARDFLATKPAAGFAIAIDREQLHRSSDRQPAASPPQVPFRNRKLHRRPASSCLFDHSFSNFKRIQRQRPAGLPVVSTSTSTLAQLVQIKGRWCEFWRLIASSQASACVNMVNGRHTVLRGTTPPTRLLLPRETVRSRGSTDD